MSYWDYALCSVSLRSIWKLQLVQNAETQVVNDVGYLAHVTPLLRGLPVCFCVEFKVIVITFKALTRFNWRTAFSHCFCPTNLIQQDWHALDPFGHEMCLFCHSTCPLEHTPSWDEDGPNPCWPSGRPWRHGNGPGLRSQVCSNADTDRLYHLLVSICISFILVSCFNHCLPRRDTGLR